MEGGSTIDHAAILHRAETLVAEGKREEAAVVAKDLLPLLSAEQHVLRMRVYLLLAQYREEGFTEEQRWWARAAAEEVITSTTFAVEERIRAHLLHCVLGPFPHEEPPPLSCAGQRWIPNEHREFLAQHVAGEVLGKGGGVERAVRRNAHVVLCTVALHHQEITAHLEALLADGDGQSILNGCNVVPEAFHHATRCAYIDRALAIVREEKHRAMLLEQKLGVLAPIFVAGVDEAMGSEEERQAFFSWMYEEFLAAFTALQRCEGARRERACGHAYLAMAAEGVDEMAMAEMHLDIARRMFEELGNVEGLLMVDRLAMGIFGGDGGEEDDEGEGADEDDSGGGGVAEEDEDGEGEDDGEWWKRGEKRE